MSFVELGFVPFIVVVIAGLAIAPTQWSRQALLLAMSLVFYASGTPWRVAIIALGVPSVAAYLCALRIEAAIEAHDKRSWLVLAIAANLLTLFYFKYANFVVENLAVVLGVASATMRVALPLGISFLTFKMMSYAIDVYRGVIPACRSPWKFSIFVLFFPEFVAGPIVRASIFLPQLERRIRLSWQRTWSAVPIILVGITKKLLIADRLAVFVDPVFARPASFSGATVASAVIAYSIQIYADFSGYTDIAIGIARVIGFDLPENFNMPYIARSITDFWRRWHITLSQWLRDYLYIALGGNRRGQARMYAALIVTMVLGGLWHGAAWNFVLWGLLHGVGLAVHKVWVRHKPSTVVLPAPIGAVIGWLLTYAFVCLGWILFRAQDMATVGIILAKITGVATGGIVSFFLPLWLLVALVVAGHIYGRRLPPGTPAADVASHGNVALLGAIVPASPFARAFVLTAWLIVLFLLSPLHRSPFIYYQF